MSTDIDKKDVIEAKWKSVVSHIQNIHNGHGGLFPACAHSGLSKRDQKETKWLTSDSEVADEFQKIVKTNHL